MISKTQIQWVKSLSQTKFRQKYDNFTAEGEKTGIEFIKSNVFPVVCAYSTRTDILQKLLPFLAASKLVLVTDKEMAMMSSFKTPSPLLAVFEKKERTCTEKDISEERSLYLDDIQDPGNLGTIIRIADWFGIKNILRSSGSADFFHPKVIQATMGSLCNVRTATTTLYHICQQHPGLPVLGALLDGQPLTKSTHLPSKGILVVGNEGHGISVENQPHISIPIQIPGHPDRIAESLNAGVATSILCHAWTQEV